MTRHEIRKAHASALATAVRRINVEHQLAGGQEIRALDHLWLKLRKDLDHSEQAGNLEAGLEAIKRYELQALTAIRRYVR